MLAVVSMALVSCGGGDGKSKSESKKPVVEIADPPMTFQKADDSYENVPLKGCFKIKQAAVADLGYHSEKNKNKISVSVTLEALQNVECDRLEGVIHIFTKDMGDLNTIPMWGGGFDNFDVSLETGDVIVVNTQVYVDPNHDARDVKYVQIQKFSGGNNK